MNKSLSVTQLNQYTLIKVSGIEAQKYLQGQVTLDILKMQTQKLYYAAHCDPKGKVIALLMIWKFDDETFFYIVPSSVAEFQLKEIKKYAIFSKVVFEQQNETTLHYINIENIDYKDKLINQLDKISLAIPLHSLNINSNQTSGLSKSHLILENSNELILINYSEVSTLFTDLATLDLRVVECDASFFDKKQIEKGIAIIGETNTQEFLPQALNVQALDAISFSKGCYTGQEMVARAKYRGANKRALYFLKGVSSDTPKLGDSLRLKLGENFKETGKIIAFVKEEKTLFLQAVLSQGLEEDSIFYLNHSECQLTIQKLPYALD